jgi:hypothetical protein
LISNEKKIVKFLTLFFIILVFSIVNAQVLIGISPKGRPAGLLEIYPEETGSLELSVFNSGAQQENIAMKIRGDEAIAFLENGNIQQAIARKIFLNPQEKKTIELQLIALKESDKIQAITIEYEKNFLQQAIVKIPPTKILIEATVPVTKKNFGSFKAKATNLSEETIRSIRLELVPMPGIDSDATPFALDLLMPKEHFEKEFAFYLNAPFETKTIVLLVSFSDANGFHSLQKNIKFNPLYNADNIILVLASILLIALVVLGIKTFMKPKEKKKEEKTGEKKDSQKNRF